MNKKKTAFITVMVIIIIFVVAAILCTSSSKGQLIIDRKAEYTPKTYYKVEFTTEKTGKLKIELQSPDSEANILWYLCDVNETIFNQKVQSGDFSEIIYKSDTVGSSSIKREINIDKTGIFTFVFIQTNPIVQNKEISVHVEFIPS